MIDRYHQNLAQYLEPGRVLVIYGPRRVGKTTLLNSFLSKVNTKYRCDTGDDADARKALSSESLSEIKQYVGDNKLIIVDEAQRIPNIGTGLKLIVDHIPGVQVVVTGSSSFALAGQVGEPLTGRKRTISFFPLSQIELAKHYGIFDLKQKLADTLVFGSYPAVETASTKEKKRGVLEELVDSYLLMDVLAFEKIKNSNIVRDLLKLIAFQVGNEVSLREIGALLGIEYKTVARYLDILEKAFVLYNLRGYSRNLRKEVTKKSKYYFYDNGVRNAIISNYNSLDLRDDIGRLWENFLVIERLKAQAYLPIHTNNYFWRTWDQKEIDWVEEREGKLFGYEFKWGGRKVYKVPKTFIDTYKNASVEVITPDNYLPFVGVDNKYD